MATLKLDFSKELGPIKQMHEVGQPPFTGGFLKLDFSPMQYLKDANIGYARLHDVGGGFGGNLYVDIPNIFRDFDADEFDPESYDFAFTDELLKGMAEYDIKPIYRLGVTIENYRHIKAYHIYPPKDFQKWARICEHIVRHYNEGWADGFHYGIEYWEIWNEPDSDVLDKNQMWLGSPEEYYQLYDIAAKHLKKCFGDSIKVGGYAACTPYFIGYDPVRYGLNKPKKEKPISEQAAYREKFIHGFFNYIKAHGSPLDYFTWHCYRDVEGTIEVAHFFARLLKEYGFEGLENHLNEWNGPHTSIQRGTSYASSQAAATMLSLQDAPVDMLCYYDARFGSGSTYAGMFNPITHKPFCTYYSFVAFGKLYALGKQAECISDTGGIYAVAATNGEKKALMIANITGEDQTLTINQEGGKVYLIDETHFLTLTDRNSAAFTLKKDETIYIEY